MKSLLSKILLAQVLTVVVALLTVALITRYSLHRGFIDFLERQETAVLQELAPELAALYAAEESWDFLRERPDRWRQILRRTREQVHAAGDAPPRPAFGRGDGQRRSGGGPPWSQRGAERLTWLGSFDRLQLRDRLFLLDGGREYVAGAHRAPGEDVALAAVEVEGAAVGWIGFRPVVGAMPPEVQRFLGRQVQILTLSLLVALALASLAAFALARHFSRPLERLEETVDELARGRFERRAEARADDEIGRLALNVNRLAETLEQSRSARRRWMADIAHELRTPVAILKGEIEAMTDGVRTADARTLASLQEEVSQLSVLVDDLQTLALADAGALDLDRQTLDLGQLAEQVAGSFRERLAARGLRLEAALEEGVAVRADAQRLRQLLHNLLENCCRYADPGGQLRLAVTATPAGAELSVADSGPGVDSEQLQNLFDRFFRAEGSRSRASGGSGLGLAICRNIAQAHGGSIEARHSPMGGLEIRLRLPA